MNTKHTTDSAVQELQIAAARLLAFAYRTENPRNEYINIQRDTLPASESITPILSMIFHKKIPSYGVIDPPDWLVYMFSLCSDSSPGYAQMMYHELLESINTTKFNGKGITKNYHITTEDFSNCFYMEFPFTALPHINDKYSKMWDAQKRPRNSSMESDNQCDYPEYWISLMADE